MENRKLQHHRKHIRKSPPYILAWIGMIIGALVIIWGIVYKIVFIDNAIYKHWYTTLFFEHFTQFTILTNLLLVVFYFLWLTCLKRKLFDNNKFLIYTATYIALVFMIAWFMMTPIFVFGKTLKADAFAGIDTVLVHLVTPTIFIIFTYFARKYPKRKNSEAAIKYGKDFVIAFIVPLTYFTYLVVINFIPLPLTMLKDMYKNQFIDAYHNQQYFSDTKFYISVYSILTNYNHNCHIPIWLGSQFYFFNIDAPGAWTYDNEGSLLRLLSVPVALGFYFLEFVLFAYWNNRAIVDKYLPSLSRTDGYDLQTKNVLTKRNSSK